MSILSAIFSNRLATEGNGHPLTWDYLRLMSTPNHRRHFGALGATASGHQGEQRRRHKTSVRLTLADRPGTAFSNSAGIPPSLRVAHGPTPRSSIGRHFDRCRRPGAT